MNIFYYDLRKGNMKNFNIRPFPGILLSVLLILGVVACEEPPYSLSVVVEGETGGQVYSDDGMIDCPDWECAHVYETKGTSLTLTAEADEGYSFKGFEGDIQCSAGETICSVPMDRDRIVRAAFEPAVHTLTLEIKDNIGGHVEDTKGDIVCEDSCRYTYEGFADVTLTAIAGRGNGFTYKFMGFEGDSECAEEDTCTLKMDRNRSLVAVFEPGVLDDLEKSEECVKCDAWGAIHFDDLLNVPSDNDTKIVELYYLADTLTCNGVCTFGVEWADGTKAIYGNPTAELRPLHLDLKNDEYIVKIIGRTNSLDEIRYVSVVTNLGRERGFGFHPNAPYTKEIKAPGGRHIVGFWGIMQEEGISFLAHHWLKKLGVYHLSIP